MRVCEGRGPRGPRLLGGEVANGESGGGQNVENYRVQRSQPADSSKLAVHSETAVIPAGIVRAFPLENHFIDVIFLGKCFHRTETHSQSMICEDNICGARGKQLLFTGTTDAEIKPTPDRAR